MTKNEINQEYSQLCAQLGQLEATIAIDKPRIIKRIEELNEVARSLPTEEPTEKAAQ